MPCLMRLMPTETAVRDTFLLMRPHPWPASPSALPRLWLSGQAPCAEAPPLSATLPLSKRRTCTFVSRHLLRAEIDFDEFVTVMRVHHRGRPAAGMVSMPASLHPRRMRKKPSSPHSGPQLLATSQYGPPLSSSPQPISLTAWPPMGSLACADRRYTPLW